MRYTIKDKSGNIINTIVASPDFVEGYCQANGLAFEEIKEDAHAPGPEPEQAPTIWDELDAAYQEGVNSAYDS